MDPADTRCSGAESRDVVEPWRIIIVDDHPTFRDGLALLLGDVPTVQVVATAEDGQQAIDVTVAEQPDVVLMDLHMPRLNGIEATQKIKILAPAVRVLVLTMLEDDESVFAAMQAGAKGYLLKGADQDEIVRAVEAVGKGELIFGPGVAERVLRFFQARPAEPPPVDPAAAFPELTARELELLNLIAAGYDNTKIANELHLSTKTVRNHVSNIFSKLQVAYRAEAIVRARDAGLGTRPQV
jgi:DNA-binding NarL/FixJ family response regulator